MAFDVIYRGELNATSSSFTLSAAQAVSAGAQVDDVIVITFSIDGNRSSTTTTSSTGWVSLFAPIAPQATGTGAQTMAAFAKKLTNLTDGFTVNFGASEDVVGSIWILRDTGVANVATDIQVFVTSGNTQPARSGFASDREWYGLASMISVQGSSGLPAAYSSSNWTNLRSKAQGTTNSGSGIRMADKKDNSFPAQNNVSNGYANVLIVVPGPAASVVQKIAIGSTLLDGVDDIRIGNDTVSKIYVGETLVYG